MNGDFIWLGKKVIVLQHGTIEINLKTKLERDLFDLAEVLGVGTKNSDICLRAIKKIQELEGDVTDLTAKTRRAL
jgi:hypothetical protein